MEFTEKLPPPVRYATYPTDVRGMVGQIVGPTTTLEFVQATSADYDETTGRTRIGFAYVQVP
ncbi:hypothetical protein PZ938_02980 [Luteipulveratus sp. YIM 133132]|uniref:hypothetical protein n=1 Tax=Luteipulveratus flavus TaxID=3031728 RepID=UPI0023B06831|nr:hypothetical protein [Luteipulveratus sp. YIM 133132]MDE9364556.1 hypothetical protein [Luteipulveratus sp. YIM 133132]